MQLRGRHVDVDHGDVARRVGAYYARRRRAAVLELHGDRTGVGDDVLVGEDVAAVVVDDAGALAGRRLTAAAPAAAPAERELVRLRLRGHGDVDDTRRGGLVDLVDTQALARAERRRQRGVAALGHPLRGGRARGAPAAAGDDQCDRPTGDGTP